MTPEELDSTQNAPREHVNVEFWGRLLTEGEYNRVAFDHNTYKSIRLYSPEFSLYYSIWCTNEHELYDMTVRLPQFCPLNFPDDSFIQIPFMNETEMLTRLQVDPGQLNNLLAANSSLQTDILIAGYPVSTVVSRLDALLLVLKSCKGRTCQEPWKQLHPAGNVETLADALHDRYDEFYAAQAPVSFEYCANGYIVDAEGPRWETDSLLVRDGLAWHEWV